jgi:hypothetical protein
VGLQFAALSLNLRVPAVGQVSEKGLQDRQTAKAMQRVSAVGQVSGDEFAGQADCKGNATKCNHMQRSHV